MIGEIIAFGLITASLVGYTAYDSKQMEKNAKENEVKFREAAFAEMDKAGLAIVDFPKYEDALNGERHLKMREIIDIYYVCRSRRKR